MVFPAARGIPGTRGARPAGRDARAALVAFYKEVTLESTHPLPRVKTYDPAPNVSSDERVPPLEEFLRLVNCSAPSP